MATTDPALRVEWQQRAHHDSVSEYRYYPCKEQIRPLLARSSGHWRSKKHVGRALIDSSDTPTRSLPDVRRHGLALTFKRQRHPIPGKPRPAIFDRPAQRTFVDPGRSQQRIALGHLQQQGLRRGGADSRQAG